LGYQQGLGMIPPATPPLVWTK